MTDKINHHSINEETDFKVNKDKHEAKKRKFKPKTKVQRLKSVFYILTGVWMFCQGLSALLASTGFYYLASIYIQANSFLVGCFVIGISLGLELAFNTLNTTIAKQKYDDKTNVSTILKVMVVVFGLVYAGSTFIGTPYAVQFLAAAPDYNDIEQIRIEHDIFIKSDTSFWNGQISKKEETKATFEGLMSKYDAKINAVRLRSDAVKPVKVMNDSITSLNSTKLASLAILKLGQRNAIDKAEEENAIMKADHLAWCASFGWGLSFVSIFCIFIFLPSFHWCQKYERKEIEDNDSILSKIEESKEKTKAKERFEIEKLKANAPKVEVQDKGQEDTKVADNEESRSMQFATANIKEGVVEKGQGRKRDKVYCSVDGNLRLCTYGDVNTLIGGQGEGPKGDIRRKHLRSLRDKLPTPKNAVPK